MMAASEVLRRAKEEAENKDERCWQAYSKWLKSVGTAGDFWITWLAGWKGGVDRAIALAEKEEKNG